MFSELQLGVLNLSTASPDTVSQLDIQVGPLTLLRLHQVLITYIKIQSYTLCLVARHPAGVAFTTSPLLLAQQLGTHVTNTLDLVITYLSEP